MWRKSRLRVVSFSNEWSHNFTESWSRPIHRPKDLTSRTRLRTASARRRTRPIMAPLVDCPAFDLLIILTPWPMFSSVRLRIVTRELSAESGGRIIRLLPTLDCTKITWAKSYCFSISGELLITKRKQCMRDISHFFSFICRRDEIRKNLISKGWNYLNFLEPPESLPFSLSLSILSSKPTGRNRNSEIYHVTLLSQGGTVACRRWLFIARESSIIYTESRRAEGWWIGRANSVDCG